MDGPKISSAALTSASANETVSRGAGASSVANSVVDFFLRLRGATVLVGFLRVRFFLVGISSDVVATSMTSITGTSTTSMPGATAITGAVSTSISTSTPTLIAAISAISADEAGKISGSTSNDGWTGPAFGSLPGAATRVSTNARATELVGVAGAFAH